MEQEKYSVSKSGLLSKVYERERGAFASVIYLLDSEWTDESLANQHCALLNEKDAQEKLLAKEYRDKLFSEFINGCTLVPFDLTRFEKGDYSKIVLRGFERNSRPMYVLPEIEKRIFRKKRLVVITPQEEMWHDTLLFYDLNGINTHGSWWSMPEPENDLLMLVKNQQQ